jgi:multiple sugar transport system substrate-binding protein
MIPAGGEVHANVNPTRRHQREEASMDMKEYDRKTFIAASAKAFAERRITKREFLRRLGIAGLGLSGFAAAMLGRTRPFPGLTPPPAMADTGASPEMTKWLQQVGGQVVCPHST